MNYQLSNSKNKLTTYDLRLKTCSETSEASPILKIMIFKPKNRKLTTVSRKLILATVILFLFQWHLIGQHTFSIVAVDTATLEVGSAGATCLSINREGYEALIISRLHPGVGAIHTQSYWTAWNQDMASEQMNLGLNSEEIIDYLIQNDVENNPSIRQYGIAHLDSKGKPDAAGYTGENCFNSKKHIANRSYSIQGNILLGEYVVDSMEARYLRSKGPLAERLMEAMKGALIAGADSRCLSEGLSSRSSFLRVAKPSDTTNYYLDIHVPSTRNGVDPIDSLETLYKNWIQFIKTKDLNINDITINYNRLSRSIIINNINTSNKNKLSIYNIHGIECLNSDIEPNKDYHVNDNMVSGIYYLIIRDQTKIIKTTKLLIY